MNTPNNAAALERLAAIGELIRTQNNRVTDSPIFIVQQKRRIYGIEDGYSDNYVWIDGESTYTDEEKAARDAARAEDELPPAEYRQCGYIDIWEFVTACFTEQGCKDYLRQNAHNLREPRIYAEGSFRNAEWRAVREYLATVAQPDALTSQPSGEAVAWRFLDEDGKPTSKWADIDAKPMHYWQGNLRDGPYPGTSIQYAYPHPSADAPGVAVDDGMVGQKDCSDWKCVSNELPLRCGWYIGLNYGEVEPLRWDGSNWHHTRVTRDLALPSHWRTFDSVTRPLAALAPKPEGGHAD